MQKKLKSKRFTKMRTTSRGKIEVYDSTHDMWVTYIMVAHLLPQSDVAAIEHSSDSSFEGGGGSFGGGGADGGWDSDSGGSDGGGD